MALGTDVPVVFCNDDEVAAKLHVISGGVFDQVCCVCYFVNRRHGENYPPFLWENITSRKCSSNSLCFTLILSFI